MTRGTINLVIMAVAVALLFGASGSLWAEPFGIPVSDQLVKGKLFVDSKSLAQFEIREGAMVVVRQEGGWSFGLVPVLSDRRAVSFLVFEIHDMGSESQAIVQVSGEEGAHEIPFDAVIPSRLIGPLAVTIQLVEEKRFRARPRVNPLKETRPSQLRRSFGPSGGGMCTAFCNGVSVTATAVTMECAVCESGALESVN